MASNRRRHQRLVRAGGTHARSTRKRVRICFCAFVAAGVLALLSSFMHSELPLEGGGAAREAVTQRSTLLEALAEPQATSSAGTTPSAISDADIVDASSEVLERYKNTPECSLVYAGYIDLFGNVWACLVTGNSWAEICVVRAEAGGEVQTSLARIDTSLLQGRGGDAS